jgi:hypothetical protein
VHLRSTAALLGTAAALSACGGSASSSSTTPSNLPNIADVQGGIAATILKFDHVRARVFCPTKVPQIPGETFSCVGVATSPKVQTFIFQATVHNGTLVSWARTA